MRNRIRKFLAPTRKPPRRNLTGEFFCRLGDTHFELGVPFECGPCMQKLIQALAWQKGWMLKKAYYAGHEAGMDGKPASDNPHDIPVGTALGLDRELAAEWAKGHRATRFIIEH